MSTIEEQLPAFHYFQVGNGYTGNMGNQRYRIVTDKSEKKMTAHVYNGPLCFELTQEQGKILFTSEFELSPDGFEACKKWIAQRAEEAREL